MPALVCLVNKFHRVLSMPRSKEKIGKDTDQTLGFPFWRYLFHWTTWHTDNCSLHMVIKPVVHGGSTETISLFSQKKISLESVKKLKARKFCLFPLYSPHGLSLQRKKLDWPEAVGSWQGHADAFISCHCLSTIINCFVNNRGSRDIMLMSESLKEHMIVCFPLLSFDEGVWVLWA